MSCRAVCTAKRRDRLPTLTRSKEEHDSLFECGSRAKFQPQRNDLAAGHDLIRRPGAGVDRFPVCVPGSVTDHRKGQAETGHGQDMAKYDDLLGKAVKSIAGTFKKRLAVGLTAGRDFVIPDQSEQAKDDNDFELITWLVIKD